jgi:hypothetical protein
VEAFFFFGEAFDAAAVLPVIGFLCGRCSDTGSASVNASFPVFSASASMFDAVFLVDNVIGRFGNFRIEQAEQHIFGFEDALAGLLNAFEPLGHDIVERHFQRVHWISFFASADSIHSDQGKPLLPSL